MGDQAVKILVSAVEEQEDQFLTMLHGSDISLRWGMPAFFVDMKKQIYSFIFDETIPEKPKWKYVIKINIITALTIYVRIFRICESVFFVQDGDVHSTGSRPKPGLISLSTLSFY